MSSCVAAKMSCTVARTRMCSKEGCLEAKVARRDARQVHVYRKPLQKQGLGIIVHVGKLGACQFLMYSASETWTT